MSEWIAIRATEKCPICSRKGWCTKTRDGSTIKCMRVPSTLPVKNGGWVHHTEDRGGSMVKLAPSAPSPEKLTSVELRLLNDNAQSAIPPYKLSRFSKTMGLSEPAMHFLGIGWLNEVPMKKRSGSVEAVSAWSFPMSRVKAMGANALCGLRLRTMFGDKFSFTGGSEGLFIPTAQDDGLLLVCEGPTSCAALVDLGFNVIGRPNCSGGNAEVIRYARVNRISDIVVVGDNDQKKIRPDGSCFHPGQDGAARLADELAAEGFSARVLIPPVKDVRDWKNAGAKRGDVSSSIAKLQPWRRRVA